MAVEFTAQALSSFRSGVGARILDIYKRRLPQRPFIREVKEVDSVNVSESIGLSILMSAFMADREGQAGRHCLVLSRQTRGLAIWTTERTGINGEALELRWRMRDALGPYAPEELRWAFSAAWVIGAYADAYAMGDYLE